MAVDLKSSENLARGGAQRGQAGELVESSLSHLWMAVSEHGGLVIRTEGDALHAIFPAGDIENPVSAAFAAADAMTGKLKELERRFESQGLSALMPDGGLHFRAAVLEGDIRPIWQDYGGTRLASWVETGHANAFVEVARILELEREVGDGALGASVVLTKSTLKSRAAHGKLSGHWLFDHRAFAAKHGRKFEVAAYVTVAGAAGDA
jgi:hypothetical protein